MLFIGNQKPISYLQKSLERGQLNHAYIFSGPEHVGKFTLAKMFALSVIGGNALSLDVENEDKNALLDLIVVQPEITEKKNVIKKRDISIETIRDAKLSLSLFPYHGKYKVLIIDDAHKMTVAAQNALLKILEEPNETTMIIMVTNGADKILPTIRSRVQAINFFLANDAEMKKFFSEETVSLSIGRPGLAKIIDQDGNERAFMIETQKKLDEVEKKSLGEKFIMAEEFSRDIVKTLERLNVWIWEIRKKAIAADDGGRAIAFDKIEKIQKSIETLKNTNANSRLVLEVLFMDI